MWFWFVLLSVFGWSVLNVLDSVLVHSYERKPMTLMWSQSLLSVPILIAIPFFADVHTQWVLPLLAFGALAYAGDLWFFRSLESVDVSVINIAWATLSLMLSVAGFLFFGESWTVIQTAGALLVIGGVLILSAHHHFPFKDTLRLLGILACLYFPYYVFKKVALESGEPPLAVFYWMLSGREMLSFSLPFFFPEVRTRALLAIRKNISFTFINAIVIASFLLAEFTGTLAYARGPLSLVVIVNNIQPFIVMLLAWIVQKTVPKRSPKELLTSQTLKVKILSFGTVFLGLALLAASE